MIRVLHSKQNTKQMKKVMMALAIILPAFGWSCSKATKPSAGNPNQSNEVILLWNTAAFQAMGANYQHSLLASRINAMVHLAMHDAINAIEPVYKTYVFKRTKGQGNLEAAAAGAAHTVLAASFPDKKAALDSLLHSSLKHLANDDDKVRGLAIGVEAGNAILENRKEDGAGLDPIGSVAPSSTPAVYQAVPPFNFVFAPHWKTMKLFGLKTHDQFRSSPPPALNSVAYATAFNEVKVMGKNMSTVRSANETAYARFWYEFSEIGWNRVAFTVVKNTKPDLHSTARAFALLNIALADAYTAGWDSKFHYNFWRPYTAIRSAANDGNPQTEADPNWEPAEPTPPVQDYPSTHSALGNAGATVLTKVFGPNVHFTMTSLTAVPAGSTRSFKNFLQAADENADSRVKAGIHFRFACEAGQLLGNKIGEYVVANYLQPLNN
jgi:hypothetical protein